MSPLLLLPFASSEALAVPVSQLFRVGYEVDLVQTDDLLPEPNGDDYFKENGVYRARWAKVEVRRASDNALLQSLSLDSEGEKVITFDQPTVAVKLRLWAQNDVGAEGRYVNVYDDVGDTAPLYVDGPTFTPLTLLGSTTYPTDVVFDAAAPGQGWINVAAVASWVVHRRKGAFPTFSDNGAIYKLTMRSPEEVFGPDFADLPGLYDPLDLTVLIDPTDPLGYKLKYLIAHEFGHELQHWANYPGSGPVFVFKTAFDMSVADDSCPSTDDDHRIPSKEHHSSALMEGMADWVAAVAFNNTNQSDCRISPIGVTWHKYADQSFLAFSCQGYTTDPNDDEDDAGVEFDFGVGGLDYFGETHGFAPNQVSCLDFSPTTGVATEFDWLRFLWDLTHSEGVPFTAIVDAYDQASPESWTTGVNAKPAFEYALGTYQGYGAEYSAQAERNGVHR